MHRRPSFREPQITLLPMTSEPSLPAFPLESSIQDVPDALLCEILGVVAQGDVCALLKCAAVARRWCLAAQQVLGTGTHDLAPRGNVTAHAMVWMGSCPQLLRVSSLRVNGSAAVAGLTFLSTSELGRQRLNQLTMLGLDTCRQLRSDVLHSTLVHCSSLRSLELVNCSKLTDVALHHISLHCTGLTQLVLKDIHGIYDDAVRHLAQHCPLLQHLTLDGALHVGSAALCAVATHCTALTHMSVAKCTRVTDSGLKALASSCPGLQSVCVFMCHALTSVGCLANSPLVSLDLRGVARVSPADLRVLLSGKAVQTLRRLLLDGCGGVDSGDTLVDLGRSCTQLQELHCQHVPDLDDQHLSRLAAVCTSLTTLGLVWQPLIHGAGLGILLAANSCLTDLDLDACFNLDGDILQTIAVCAPGLTRLNMHMCTDTPSGTAAGDWLTACKQIRSTGKTIKGKATRGSP